MLRSRWVLWLAVVLCGLVFVLPTQAVVISFFNNGTYVDTGQEGANLQTTLVNLGHTVNTFTGITAADFIAATTGVSLLVFPEMERANLNNDLDAAARAVLSSFVGGGGGMIQANAWPDNINLPNALFGYSLTQSGSLGWTTYLDAAQAAGTPFAGGPASLPASDAVEAVDETTLPPGALNIYHHLGYSTVFATQFGLGHYVYLGFDWYEDSPIPPEWEEVTGLAVQHALGGGPGPIIPEPSTYVLFGLGALGLMAWRRRRAG